MGIFSFIETKPNYDEIDFQNIHFQALLNGTIHEMQHLMVYGIDGCGKTTQIYSFLASLLKTKDIYSIQSAIYEEDRKEIHYRYSPYHIEFSPLDLSSYESIFVMGFLKEYVKSKNVGHDIPKIVYIKNAEHLSFKSNKALGTMLEKNIESARFIFECRTTSPFLESLRGRCVKIRMPYPKEEEIQNAMVRLFKKQYDQEIKKEDIQKAIETGEYFGKNMKHIFGALNTYYMTGEWVKLASNIKMDILVNFILDEENWGKYSSYERIREIVQELYIDLIPLDQVLKYVVRKVSQKYHQHDFMLRVIQIAIQYDLSMKMGNKLTIHLETFIIHLIEILSTQFCKKTFNIK
jgi:hypothetical protein